MKRTYRLIGCAAAALLSSSVDGFSPSSVPISSSLRTRSRTTYRSAFVTCDVEEAATSSPSSSFNAQSDQQQKQWSSSALGSVLTASLMITGNTFGAGCLVLPELASASGFMPFSSLFIGAWIVNLISGLVIADIAIAQEKSSFKEIAADQSHVATAISVTSLMVNSCVLSFDLHRVGQVLGSPMLATTAVAGTVGLLLQNMSKQSLSQTASVFTTVLFASFGLLLVPGLEHMDTSLLWADSTESLSQAAPVVLMAMIYQNIVPSIAKLLDYNRAHVTAALTLGSAIPLVMYLTWCAVGVAGSIPLEWEALLTVFSLAALAGSSLGSGLSLTEEYETYQAPVGVALGIPLAAALTCHATHTDVTWFLGLAGTYGSPLLYGILPGILWWQQRGQEWSFTGRRAQQPETTKS